MYAYGGFSDCRSGVLTKEQAKGAQSTKDKLQQSHHINLLTLWTSETMNLACATNVEDNFIVLSMGATVEATKHDMIISHLIAFVDIDIHVSQNIIFNTIGFI